MSLFIIGSVSRITSNIVHELVRNKQYNRITIADILPAYEFHHRFYRLQSELQSIQSTTTLSLQRLININDFDKQNAYDDVLFVTHDYYTSVSSKTKIMEQTTKACSKRENLFFATPLQYDHFAYQYPQTNYIQTQKKVAQINRNSTIIRSDVQDNTELAAYFNSPKTNPLEKTIFDSKFHFSARIASGLFYANFVANVLKDKVKGKKFIVRGPQNKNILYANFNKDVAPSQYAHAKQNIIHLAQKYHSLHLEGYQQVKQKEEVTQNQ